MNESREKELFETIKKLNIELDKRQVCQFLDYYDLLVSWNEKMNLTAVTSFPDVCLKHFADSLSLIKLFDSFDDFVNFFSGKTLIDVGTGAGFPGIPLKILVPNCKITLMDSLDKRIKFLNEVIAGLELEGIETIHGRVEDFAHDKTMRESFDISVARAVAALPVLSEYCLPFVKVGGIFIAMKSEKAGEELAMSNHALDTLGGTLKKNVSFNLLDSSLSRTLLLFEKEKETPKAYPRKAGTPSKKPL